MVFDVLRFKLHLWTFLSLILMGEIENEKRHFILAHAGLDPSGFSKLIRTGKIRPGSGTGHY